MGIGRDEDAARRMVGWLQKALGYSMTGSTWEKAVFVCHGSGDNGKSTLLDTVRMILKEYSAILQIDSLMVRREESNNAQSDLADLRGARFAMTSETEAGQRLAEGKLKRISQGMGEVKAVRKYENPIVFPETHKLWMDANHKPVVRGNDNAIWNRLHLIPFDVTIPKAEQDRELGSKLLGEAGGILAWLVAGAVRWHREGLGKPPEVLAAGANWRQESDVLGDFINDRCELRPEAETQFKDLYGAYVDWCQKNNERPISRRAFSDAMVERGCDRGRNKDAKTLLGVRLQ